MSSDANDIHEIERRLKTAQIRLERAMSNVTLKHDSPEWQEYELAKQDVLRLERLRAAATDDEYAETIEFPARWDIGAPLPHLFVSDDRALLAFLLAEYDPEWDGTYVTAKSPAGNEPESLALVEFEYCVSAKLGDPNDEVFSGHPLQGKGLEAYAAQRVITLVGSRKSRRSTAFTPNIDPQRGAIFSTSFSGFTIRRSSAWHDRSRWKSIGYG